jgi:hypothetical protein
MPHNSRLGGPILLVWDNLNLHKDADLRDFAASRDWMTNNYPLLRVSGLDSVEGVRSLLRRGWLPDVAFCTPERSTSTSGSTCDTSGTAGTSQGLPR